MLFIIIFLIVLIIILYVWKNPTVTFIPYNYFISMITQKKVFYDQLEKEDIFPLSKKLEQNYLSIRQEALNVYQYIQGNVAKTLISQNDDFYKGWETFPLRMFGHDVKANLELCPMLAELLKNHDEVPTAFFSLMAPRKHLTAHYGPFKGILRYHLGLIIPPPESGDCFISVDDIHYYWKEGEGKLFDESYLHYVENNTNYSRIILFLDVKRPFITPFMNMINDLILKIIGLSPHNQKVVKRYSEQLLDKLCETL